MPSTPLPLRASWHSAALPIAPSPSTIVSKRFIRVMGSREAKAGDGNPGADAARYASAFPAPPGCREHHARESAAQARSPGIPVLHDRSADAPAVRAAVDVAPRPADRALRQPDWRRAAPAAAIERVAPPQIEREVVPPVELPQRAVPAAPAAVIERVAPPRVEREVAPPVELPQRAVPAAPVAPIEHVAPPQIEREVAPPVELPNRALPAAPAAPIERVAPPQIEREVVPPVELPQRAVPAAPVAPIERVAPPQIEREVVPPVELPPRAVPA